MYQRDEPGQRGGTLYRKDMDGRRFLGLLGELTERFGLGVTLFRVRSFSHEGHEVHERGGPAPNTHAG